MCTEGGESEVQSEDRFGGRESEQEVSTCGSPLGEKRINM